MFIQMSFCSSSDPEIIALITFMTCGFKLLMWSLIVQYAVSSPFYFLSARCSWVESNNCCKIFQDCIRHICIYDKSFSFWQNTCALLAFHLLRCTAPLFFWMVIFYWSYCWQVAIFVVLAMTLRRKPEVLINIMPKIMGNNKYLGQEKLPIIVWVIAQVFFCLVPVMLVTYTALFFSIL